MPEQIRTRIGIELDTFFTITADDIMFTTRVKTEDGTGWVPVVHVDLSKLAIHEGHTVNQQVLKV